MSNLTTSFAEEYLKLLFQNVQLDNIGSGLRNATTAGSLFIALLTDDNPITEVTYGGYVRAGITRTTTSWAVTGRQCRNNINIVFAARTDAGTITATHFAICKAITGSDFILVAPLQTPLVITEAIQPRILMNALLIEG